ncbi:MAG: anti-sigma factor, partial [Cyanobacteria bacterium P01_D01_bin.14]
MDSERKLDELAADYVTGNLSAEEADEFARLVVDHPELRSEVDRFEKTVGLMLNELPMMEPPSRLRDSIFAAVETPVPQPRRSTVTWVLAALAAGATVLSLALGANNYRLRLA